MKNCGYAGDWDEYVKHWEKYATLEPTNTGRIDLVYRMVMTVATCTTEQGFDRLLSETRWVYGGTRSRQFFFLSRELVRYCLERLGFEVVRLEEIRDINFVARKLRPVAFELQAVR